MAKANSTDDVRVVSAELPVIDYLLGKVGHPKIRLTSLSPSQLTDLIVENLQAARSKLGHMGKPLTMAELEARIFAGEFFSKGR